jgi:hypothetical protein
MEGEGKRVFMLIDEQPGIISRGLSKHRSEGTVSELGKGRFDEPQGIDT